MSYPNWKLQQTLVIKIQHFQMSSLNIARNCILPHCYTFPTYTSHIFDLLHVSIIKGVFTYDSLA